MKNLLFTIFVLISPIFLYSQVTGKVVDTENDLLPYVNIYVEGTTIGTTSNTNGEYLLKLKPGEYTLNYQFIGYKTHKERREVLFSIS